MFIQTFSRAHFSRACACAIVVMLLMVACSGSDDGATPTAASTSTATSATSTATATQAPSEVAISAAEGGAVASEDGVITLSIPAGALAEDTDISITAVDAPESLEGAPLAGVVYELQPSGLTFLQPAEVTFSADAGEPGTTPLLVPISVSDAGDFEFLSEVRITPDGTVTANLEHFSVIAALAGGILVIADDGEEIAVGDTWLAEIYLKATGVLELSDVAIDDIFAFSPDESIVTKGDASPVSPGSEATFLTRWVQPFTCEGEGFVIAEVAVDVSLPASWVTSLFALLVNLFSDSAQSNQNVTITAETYILTRCEDSPPIGPPPGTVVANNTPVPTNTSTPTGGLTFATLTPVPTTPPTNTPTPGVTIATLTPVPPVAPTETPTPGLTFATLTPVPPGPSTPTPTPTSTSTSTPTSVPTSTPTPTPTTAAGCLPATFAGNVVTINNACLDPLFFAFNPNAGDPFWHLHTDQPDIFLSLELYTVYGDQFDGSPGTYTVNCGLPIGICIYFDRDGVGGFGVELAIGGTLNVVTLANGAYSVSFTATFPSGLSITQVAWVGP